MSPSVISARSRQADASKRFDDDASALAVDGHESEAVAAARLGVNGGDVRRGERLPSTRVYAAPERPGIGMQLCAVILIFVLDLASVTVPVLRAA